MTIIQRVAWTEQPRVPTGINQGNPIAMKASAVAVPYSGGVLAYGLRRPADRLCLPNGPGINNAPSLRWIGVGQAGASTTDVLRLSATASRTDTAWEEPVAAATWLAYVVRFGNNFNGNAPIFANISPDTSPYSAWAIVDRAGNGAFWVECSAGGIVNSIDMGQVLDNNTPMVLVGRYNGAALEGFKNGIKRGSTACSGNLLYTNASNRGPAIGNFYNYTASARSFNGRVFLAALFPVALSDAEIFALSQNPWQILAPQTRTIFGPSAVGGDATVALTGVAGTGAAGLLVPGVSLSVAGISATGAAGTLAPSVVASLTGVAGTGAAGLLVPGVSLSVAGVSATGAAGTLAPSVVASLTGAAGTGAAGLLVPGVSLSVAGVSATGAAGVLAPVSGTTVALTGVAGTGAAGLLVPGFSLSVAGVSATGAAGTLTPVSGTTVALTGVAGTGAAGLLVPGFSLSVAGVSAAGAAGILVPGVSLSVAGVSATGAVGILIPSTGTFVALSGVAGAGQHGSLAPSFALNLSGVSATGYAGTLLPPLSGGVLRPTELFIEHGYSEAFIESKPQESFIEAA